MSLTVVPRSMLIMGSCGSRVVFVLALALAMGKSARGHSTARINMMTPNPMEDGLGCRLCRLRAMMLTVFCGLDRASWVSVGVGISLDFSPFEIGTTR